MEQLVDNLNRARDNRNQVTCETTLRSRSLRPMARHLKPIVASGMLVLYAGMMLLGQSLHSLMGCEHDHVPAGFAGPTESRATGERSPTVVGGEQHLHDADGCPICQFHAQGQLAPSLPVSELRQFVAARVPLHDPPVFAVRVSGIYSPRGPPCV